MQKINIKYTAISCILAFSMILSTGCHKNTNAKSSSKNNGSSSSASMVQNTSSVDVSSVGSSSTANTSSTKTSNVSNNTSKVTSQAKITDPMKVNLGGATIKVYTSLARDQGYIFGNKTGVSQVGNAYINRLDKIQKALNCKVEVNVVPIDQMASAAFTAVASGETYGHILEAPIYKTVTYVSSGLATNLKTVPTMDLSQEYLNGGQTVKASTLGKGVWFVGTKDMYTGIMGYFFNKRILNEIGYKDTDLYNLVKNNKWTISTLKNIASKAVKDLDGKPGMTIDDRYGIIQDDLASSAVLNYLSANGADMLKADGKGGISYNMQDSKVLNAINSALDFFKKSGICYDGALTTGYEKFMSGHSLFYGQATVLVNRIVNMTDEYGYVPFPKGDNASGYVSSCNWNNTVLMISGGLKNKELSNAGAFLQAFCYLSSDCIKAQQSEYRDRYLCDDESYNMFAKSLDAAKIEPVSIFGGGADWNIHMGTFRSIYDAFSDKASPETTIQANKGVAVTALQEVMKSLNK